MSFAIWQQEPPFKFNKNDPEQIYQVGSVWVVTNNSKKATQANVDAVLSPPPLPLKTTEDKLAAVGLTLLELKVALAK